MKSQGEFRSLLSSHVIAYTTRRLIHVYTTQKLYVIHIYRDITLHYSARYDLSLARRLRLIPLKKLKLYRAVEK